MTRKNNLQTYNPIVKSTVTYGAKTCKFNKNFESKHMSMQMDFLRRSARYSSLLKKMMFLENKLVLKILF